MESELSGDQQLGYLVDVSYLVRIGEEAFRITVEGINEVQRRPTTALGRAVARSCHNALTGASPYGRELAIK